MPGFNRELVREPEVATNGAKKTRRLAIICSKGTLDMAYPPLILGHAARNQGVEVDLFFTFWGMDIITKKKRDRLHIATVGNPNMHPSFHIPTMVGGLPGMSTMASNMMRKEIADLDVPPVGEFMDMLHDSGVNFYACRMTYDMMKFKDGELVDYAEVIGAMEFIEMTEDAQVLFI